MVIGLQIPVAELAATAAIVYLGAGGVKGADLSPARIEYIFLERGRLLFPATRPTPCWHRRRR